MLAVKDRRISCASCWTPAAKCTYTYTYIYTCTYTHIHSHTYTYACICTRMQRQKILVTTPQRVKQYYRCTCASIYICMNIHIYIDINICTQPAASVSADVYVGVKTHLCNVLTCPCTSAQNTFSKVHCDQAMAGNTPRELVGV